MREGTFLQRGGDGEMALSNDIDHYRRQALREDIDRAIERLDRLDRALDGIQQAARTMVADYEERSDL